MNLEEIVTHFQRPKRRGNGRYLVRCPVPSHGQGRGDRNPSLTISESPDRKILFSCCGGGGCSPDDIIRAAGLEWKDCFPDNGSSTFFTPPHSPKSSKANGAGQPSEKGDDPFLDPPDPLPEHTSKVLPLVPDLIPEPWRDWAWDIAERMQCPPDYPTCAALVAAASLIGNKIAIRPKVHDPWLAVANLYGGLVGTPGTLKSPAVSEALRPFLSIAANERERYQNAIAAYEKEKEIDDALRSRAKKAFDKSKDLSADDLRKQLQEIGSDEPVERRLYTSDCTIEKLGEILNQNPNGILQLRDELTGWFRSLDRGGHEQDRAFYLEAWNGSGSFTFDRIARGTTHIKNLTLSLFGTIQPGIIGPYLRSASESEGADGLIQRFQLIVYPEPTKSYSYHDRQAKSFDRASRIFQKLYDLTPQLSGAKVTTSGEAFLQFTPDAQDFFREWLIGLETMIRGNEVEDPALLSHLAKYRSLMPSLALIFHLIDIVDRDVSSNGVDLDAAVLAAAWCDYLRSHAERLYNLRGTMYDTARLILRKIETGKISDLFTGRDIYIKGWHGLSDSSEVNQALAVLVDFGYLTPITMRTGGRSKTRFGIHPTILPKEGK